MSELITLTFGDMAENHVGMEQIGSMVAPGEGFQLADLEAIKAACNTACDLIDIGNEAYILRIKQGVRAFDLEQLELFAEQKTLAYDKKAFMYGRVVNKHARWNLCFDDASREPDYAAGKGRIVGYDEVPLMNTLKSRIEAVMGPKAAALKVESNYYYDTSKCGIGYHGDSERRKVVGVRLGHASMPMYYQWYQYGKPVGEPIVVPLDPGDIYVMSEKAVGTDWKKKTVLTVRHATGCSKFTEKNT